MENTKIKTGKETLNASDLYTLSEYARKFGYSISKIKYHAMAGNLKTIKVNGANLVVREEGLEIGRKEN